MNIGTNLKDNLINNLRPKELRDLSSECNSSLIGHAIFDLHVSCRDNLRFKLESSLREVTHEFRKEFKEHFE